MIIKKATGRGGGIKEFGADIDTVLMYKADN